MNVVLRLLKGRLLSSRRKYDEERRRRKKKREPFLRKSADDAYLVYPRELKEFLAYF